MTAADPSRLPYRPCVGIMVLNRAGRVWVGRRAGSKNEAEGHGLWWQMPQGGIDPGEDPRAAAVRELFEETGMRTVTIVAESRDWHTYDLPPHLIGKAWGGRYRGQRQKWFLLRFRGDDAEINITPADGHEIEFDAWRWAEAGELLSLIIPFKREVYGAVLGEFASLAVPDASI
jgi:putative (di)nucleoside polyphosphate hydrolase